MAEDEKSRFQFEHVNIETQSLSPDKKYDYILCREVLEHVKDYKTVIKKFSDLLNPGGVLVLSIPTSFTEKYFHFWDKQWFKKCGHVNVFKKRKIINLFNTQNFSVLKIGKHSFRRTIFWSIVTPFKVNHDMGKIVSHKKISKMARFISDVVCYFSFVEKIGNYVLPKSNVFYFQKRD